MLQSMQFVGSCRILSTQKQFSKMFIQCFNIPENNII